jgi:4-amino-4-deoxy-L-arabinose transferase-like glycosyltransferase
VGRWRDSLRLLHPLGIFVFLTVALPWYVLCALRHPDFVRVFFLEHNFQRYLTPVFRHEQPSWFFGPVLLLGIVPWLALLAAGVPHLLETLRVRRWAESRGLFVLCWVVFPLLFFSLSKSKLPGYILPVIPPLVLLLGRAIARAAEEQPELAARVLAAVGTTFVVIAATAGAWETKLPPDAARLAGDFALLNNWLLSVGASGAAVAILALRRRVWTALVLSSLITAGMALGILRIAARLDGTLSPRAAVATARQWNPPGQDIAAYRLHRAWHYGVNYYLQGETREWTPAMPSRTLVITSEAGLADLVARGFATAVVRRLSKQALVVLVDREQSAGGAAAQRPPATR